MTPSKAAKWAALALVAVSWGGSAHAATCARTFFANVVALDQPLMFNRLGAQNVNGTVYALRRDVVNTQSNLPLTRGGAATQGFVTLRGDKRPRPIVLRVAVGDCLTVNLENLLTDVANPFDAAVAAMQIDDQVAERFAGFHVAGMQVVGSVADDASNVGNNGSSLVGPGRSTSYTLYAEKEGAFIVSNPGAPFGGEGTQGASSTGLFGVVNVEPAGARFLRSQVTEEELRLATTGTTPSGQPIVDYAATYPATNPDGSPSIWVAEGKAGLPILSLTTAAGEIVHSDINAIIAGPNEDGTWPSGAGAPYPLERVGKRNPTLPNRLEAFREFTVNFHDEVVAAQAFPGFFNDVVTGFQHVLHGVRDSFMINYGSGGIGSEIIANRLGVGPMHDCLDCAYEEFFLTSFTVGDPAMLVDVPANAGLETLVPGQAPTPGAVGPKASKALYPDDPSNVHHSYTNDFVKFRNVHIGKEHHIFHLHNHQWLYNPNDDNANYLDAQGLGPGSGYTYEINFGGSGNRNKTAGDAIFHCHFYPHFAMGMWELWRIHDVLEAGTRLAVSGAGFHTAPFALGDGTPAAGARALPDGEIVAGAPIPAVVPLPGKAMATMPGAATVRPNPNTTVASDFNPTVDPVANPGRIVPVGSNALVVDRTRNPGYPFWIGGIEDTVGQRPTTPPLDMLSEAQAQALGTGANPLFAGRAAELVAGAGGFDGGLPRHTLDGVAAGGEFISTVTPLDFSKVVTRAKPVYFPEAGTDVEQVAMAFHAVRERASTATLLTKDAAGAPNTRAATFVTNGQPPNPSAPYHEPCVDDAGQKVLAGVPARFFGVTGLSTVGTAVFGSANPRTYKAANIQIDAVFNKVGWHYPQQRIISLWEDVLPTINKTKPPEPFAIRFNTFDCGKYLHTNLVPEAFEVDDYQVRTPTDIIGQHIHLPKWDLTTTDGSGNGWNYEDGTLSPGAVRERIEAINHFNATTPAPVQTLPGPDGLGGGRTHLDPGTHPFFGAGPRNLWVGARTTIQRWFFDPVVNVDGVDRGLGIIFSHDHYGPSTHQQIGLYASVITEPANSTWVHNETGVPLNTRPDGGPTTWQAVIKTGDLDGDGKDDSYREFWYQASDFQHAYEPGVYIGAGPDGTPNGVPPSANSFRQSVNPGARAQVNPILPDLILWSAICPAGRVRPCPEAISVADPGMFVVNYRNEPVALRVFDPNRIGPDGKAGMQARGLDGDLAYALDTRATRAIPQLNTRLGDTPYPALTNDIGNGDPFTPMMRAFAGDKVRVKVQMGGQEEELMTSIHGMKWLQGGSSFGKAGNSGWRNIQPHGISEQYAFAVPVVPFVGNAGSTADYAYAANTSEDGWWSGAWGLIRTYNGQRRDLVPLPSNPNVKGQVKAVNEKDFDGACPKTAPIRTYDVTAVLANDVLANTLGVTIVPANEAGTHVGPAPNPAGGTLVYNPRATSVGAHAGPLHDPTAMMYVYTDDLVARDPSHPGCFKVDPITLVRSFDKKLLTCPNVLRPGTPVEPITLRAAAGECVDVTLRNRLPGDANGNGLFDDNPDLGSYTTLQGIVARDRNDPRGVTTFDNNLIQPSSHVGLHPQLVAYDVTRSDGVNVGTNPKQTVSPGGTGKFRWYAGDVSFDPTTSLLTATPIEFGGSNLSPADKVKQGQKALGGALVVMPAGAAWVEDANRRSAATVTDAVNGTFRDFAVIIQKNMTHRFADGQGVENLEGAPIMTEDPQDSGQIAVNYGTEPLWFRFGLPANAPFGNAPGGLGAVPNARESFSNALVGGDPATPVFTATAGQPFRLHVGSPTGAFRGTVFTLFGHVWQRDPYVCPGSSHAGLPGKCSTAEVGSRALGVNPIGFAQGGQDGVHPQSHYDLVFPSAGGAFAKPGDYLYRDMAGFGVTSGLWGIVRAETPAPAP